MTRSIKDWQVRIHNTATQHGWWDGTEEPGDLFQAMGWKLLLMVSEIAEAGEELRDRHTYTEVYYHEEKPEGFPIEIADAVIRLLDTCEQLGIDLEKAMEIKTAFNETRPHRHGGKKA